MSNCSCFWCDRVGSPWRIDVRNPARVTVNSSGLHQMSVGKTAIFELQSTDPDSDVTVNVTRTYIIIIIIIIIIIYWKKQVTDVHA